MEITEESKALLEEYNKTVSFLLSQAPEELSNALYFSSISTLSLIPSQPALFPYSPTLLADAKCLHCLTQIPVFTLTCN